MAVKYGNILVNGIAIPASATELYALPSTLVRAIVNQARVVNYGTSGAVDLTLWVLESGGSTSSGRLKAIVSQSIAQGDWYPCNEIIGQAIETGGAIYGQASAADALSFSATGTEIDS